MSKIRGPNPLAEPLDWRLKSLPTALQGKTDAAFAPRGLNLFDGTMLYPAATLSWPVIERNSAAMRAFMADAGVSFAPHGKTTMAPQLFRKQLEDGAWGLTAATGHHVRVYRQCGVDRILFANQLVGEAEMRYVAEEQARDPGFWFASFIDHPAQVRQLARIVDETPGAPPFRVILEVGMHGGRAGLRDERAIGPIADALAAHKEHVALCGTGCYEGIFGPNTTTDQVRDLFARTLKVARQCQEASLFAPEPIILTAGGSSFFDMAATMFTKAQIGAETHVILRSGCYISHDHGMYKDALAAMEGRAASTAYQAPDLRPALMVWGLVQSFPEPTRVICALGKRDAGTDLALPDPLVFGRPGAGTKTSPLDGHRTVAMNDQHTYIDVPVGTPLEIGDLVGFGVSHPCTTFDKWRGLYAIDDGFDVVAIIRTYF